MKREHREAIRLASSLGLEDAQLIPADPHYRLVGTVKGKPVSIVMSMTKAFATERNFKCTKLNIRRAVKEAAT